MIGSLNYSTSLWLILDVHWHSFGLFTHSNLYRPIDIPAQTHLYLSLSQQKNTTIQFRT